MASITLRSVKGSPLTSTEVDTNFTNLNTAIGDLETQDTTNQANIATNAADIATAESAIDALEEYNEAIAASIAATAVDVFVYDTSKDSDGGAWRKRCQGTSWYSTDGEPSAVMPIIATSTSVSVRDGDDPDIPEWKSFDFTGYTVTAVVAKNGKIIVGTSTGLAVLDLAGDSVDVELSYTTATSPAIVDNAVNDVAITVLPDAPIDQTTALPIPTIAVATDGGVSVINNDGTVADSTKTDGMLLVDFGDNSRLFYNDDSSDQVYYADSYASDGFGDGHYDTDAAPYTLPGNATAIAGNVIGQADGLTHLSENQGAKTSGMVAYTTSDYATGWMHGDVKGAFLSSTDTASPSGTDDDRSVNGNDLTVNGTITRSAVNTGNDLVAYSGFSSSNYLQQPYNSDLDFGTDDFYVMGWFKRTAAATEMILSAKDSVSHTAGFAVYLTTAKFYFVTRESSTVSRLNPDFTGSGEWQHFVCVRDTTGTKLYLYIDGVLYDSDTVTARDCSPGSGGEMAIGVTAFDYLVPYDGSLSLIRIGAGAPTADQIKKIYEDEKHLFAEGAQATLYGSSDAVTALAYDDTTDLLHVGTSAGRSVFHGLQRVDNTTDAVGVAISAENGLVVED